mgnify:CR=1 FL=1
MPESLPNSQDIQARLAATATALESKIRENAGNLTENLAKNQAIDSVISSLPAPLNAAARLLGEGIYKAFKVPIIPVDPATIGFNQDPIKALAFSIAFAIIQIIWCFIKSLLNPLPIIGVFFPLCNNEPNATPEQLAQAVRDPTNQSLVQANRRFTDFANTNYNITSEPSTVNLTGPEEVPDVQGISFQDYLSRNGIVDGNSDEETPSDYGIPPKIPGPKTPSAEQQVEWQPGEQTFDSIRRRFGL